MPDHYVYLLQQRAYEDHRDEKGRMSIVGCYNSLQIANAAAKAEVRHIVRTGNPDIAAHEDEHYNGNLFGGTVYLYNDYPGAERVDVNVEKILCASRFEPHSPVSEGHNYIALEDGIERQEQQQQQEEEEEEEEDDEIEILDDDTPPTTPHSSLSPSKDCLVGLTFAFTGSLPNLSREEAEMMVKRCGGTVIGQPTKETSYVVLGANPAQTRLRKIRDLGIKTINEKELCQMVTGIAKSIERNGTQDEEADNLVVASSASTPRQSSIAATVGTADLDGGRLSTAQDAMNGRNEITNDNRDDFTVVSSASTPQQSFIAPTVDTADLEVSSSSTAQNALSAAFASSPQANNNGKRSREEIIEAEDIEEDKPSPKKQKELHTPEREISAEVAENAQSPGMEQERQVPGAGVVGEGIEEEKGQEQQTPEEDLVRESVEEEKISMPDQEDRPLTEKEIVAESIQEEQLSLKKPEAHLSPETKFAANRTEEEEPVPTGQEEQTEKEVVTESGIKEATG